jgi:hypothetical protein
MSKKWVIGVGLGLAGLAVVGLGGLVAVGYWADRSTDGSGMESMLDAQARARHIAELNLRHPFKPPQEGRALKLEEPRLEAYLAVREGTQPAYGVLEQETQAYVTKHGAELVRNSVSARLKAANASMRMMGKAQTALLRNLDAQRMSLVEFQAITAVLYPVGGPPPPAADNVAQLEAQLASLTPQLEDPKLTEAQRLQLEQRRAGLRKYITTLEKVSGKDVQDANAALMEKYAARISKAADPVFDELLVNPKAR